jgi:hypothetical protein
MDSLRIGKHNSEHFDVFQIDVSPRGMIKKEPVIKRGAQARQRSHKE